MNMIIDYLEDAAGNLRVLGNKLKELEAEYKKSFDRQAREEMARIRKEIAKKRHEMKMQVYLHLDELRLLKKHFPMLLEVLMEDENIGHVLKKKAWLLDFKVLQKKDCEKRLLEIRKKRKQLRETKDFLRNWVGRIDVKSIVATWPVLKDALNEGEVDKEDILTAVSDMDKKLKNEGWQLMLNDPFILKPLDRLLQMLKKAQGEEYDKRIAFDKAKGKGTTQEYNTGKVLLGTRRKKAKIERMCMHLLLANSHFLNKIKKQDMTWCDKTTGLFMKKLLEKLNAPEIHEDRWVKEMKKKLDV